MAVKKVTPVSKPFNLEFLGTMAVMTALLVFMYASTFQPETVNLLTAGILLLVIGLVFGVLFVGVGLKPFSFDRFLESIIWSVLCFAIIYIVNKKVPFTLGVQVLNARWYAVLLGVAEESFFRIFLTGFMYRITHSKFFAIILGAWIWTIYHMARYGGDAGALLVVLIAGLVLGWVFLTSMMADPVIFSHGAVNFLALGGKIPLADKIPFVNSVNSMNTANVSGGQLQAGFIPEIHDWGSLGLWALMVTIIVMVMAGIINHLTHKPYERKPSGKKPKASRKRLPSGSPKTHRKMQGPPKKRKKLKGKR